MLQIEVFHCNFVEENCYILWDEGVSDACWVIDCGAQESEEVESIAHFLLSRGLKPTLHLLTHGHFDHIWGSEALAERYDVRPTLLESERETYEKSPELLSMFVGRATNFRVPPIGSTLQHGDTLQLGSLTFEVIATPGHTPGGCCYYCHDAGVLFSGDTLFRHGMGRTDLPGGNSRQLYVSLSKLLDLPEDTIVYPGHGPSTTIGEERYYV